jgi:AraC family transcriptional regulator, transcriptional activator of pobA
MIDQSAFTLVNPQNGNLAFKIFSFESNSCFDHIQRLNYFSLIWIQKGKGKVKVDFSEYDFTENQLLAFAPYQPFMLSPDDAIEGKVIHFHPEFFCIMKHHDEIACNGVLFNNIYEPPYVIIDELAKSTFNMVLEQMKIEMQNPAMAQYELLISYLKIFLITASRLKKEQLAVTTSAVDEKSAPFVLQNLKNFIEQNFKTKHSASDYAELYLTNKAVKEIAYELGYDDEHYFSRFFKNNADVSPQTYRETVGFAKAVS